MKMCFNLGNGEGGLEELYDEFSESKILYAFCEARDKHAQVSRYILINWVRLVLNHVVMSLNHLLITFLLARRMHTNATAWCLHEPFCRCL